MPSSVTHKKRLIMRTLAVGVRYSQILNVGIFEKDQCCQEINKSQPKFQGKAKTTLPSTSRGWATFCQRKHLSLIDLKISQYIFLFLWPIQREIVTLAIKWVRLFCDYMSDFSFPNMNNFISANFLQDTHNTKVRKIICSPSLIARFNIFLEK